MLELTVFLSGALVMVLEMVGGRVLAPHVGTSAIVWTSLIGVVLACLALGAWAGGRFADQDSLPPGAGPGPGRGRTGLRAYGFLPYGAGSGRDPGRGQPVSGRRGRRLGHFRPARLFLRHDHPLCNPPAHRGRGHRRGHGGTALCPVHGGQHSGHLSGRLCADFLFRQHGHSLGRGPLHAAAFPLQRPGPALAASPAADPLYPAGPGRTGFTGNGWRKRAACAWWRARTTASGSWKAWTAPGTAGPCA